MRVLFTDVHGDCLVFASESEFLEALNDEDISMGTNWTGYSQPKAEYLPDDLKSVEVEEVEPVSRFRIVGGNDVIATPGTLPAPLENETVGAYARRISGGDI